MAPHHDVELLLQVRVAELKRSKVNVRLYANPLGQASFCLDRAKVEEGLNELRRHGLLEAGLRYASELRPLTEERSLQAAERRQFQAEIGCPPLLLACHGCGQELARLREKAGDVVDKAAIAKEKEVQALTSSIVELLLKAGARICARDVGPQGNSALHLAAKYGASQLLSTLLRMDASVSARNNDGNSAETIAERAGSTMCTQILQVAAMIEMQKTAADVENLAESQDRAAEKKKRVKERRRWKKKIERAAKAAERRAGSDPGDGDSEESAQSSEVEELSEEDEDEGATDRRDEEIKEIPSAASSGPRAAYGRNNAWSLLQEDDCVKDAELPDEWDEENWGEYVDWGEDWEAEAEEAEEFPSSGDEEDDEEEVRAQLLRLRKEKAQQLEQLYSFAAEREERRQQAEAVELEASRLSERAVRLEERRVRMEAGDLSAKDDTAAEAEVSVWWEERATSHARSVWQLEKAVAMQQKAQEEALEASRKKLREAKRKTKGLEEYWEGYCESQSAIELLEVLAAERTSRSLAKDIQRMTDSLELSPGLQARLPTLWALDAEGAEEEGTISLPPTNYLVPAVQLHKAIHDRQRRHQKAVEEMLDICNKQLTAKNDEVLGAVEEELCHRVLPQTSVASGAKAWDHLSELASHTRQVLEQRSHSPGRSCSPPRAFSRASWTLPASHVDVR